MRGNESDLSITPNILASLQTMAEMVTPRKPLTFLALDGTKSPDADQFARGMNGIKSITPKKGAPIEITTSNLAEKLRSDPNHPLARFVRGPPRASEALDLQRKGAEKIGSDDTNEAKACIDLFKKAGFSSNGDDYGADIMYVAMHANLLGKLSFCPDEVAASSHEWNSTIHLFNPVKDELDWKTVKWVIFASCGTLSFHYRYFGIPNHNARADPHDWPQRHQFVPHGNPRKYVLSHYYPGVQWLGVIKKHAPKLHGVLGYWDKAPGGDVGGMSEDAVIARDFVERLKKGETFLEAWKQHGGPQKWAWSALVDEKYAGETLADLATNKLGDPGQRKWMYASLYTGPLDERKTQPVPIPVKEAFLEANSMERYTERPLSGVTRLHHDLMKPLKKEEFYPDDLMTPRRDPNVKYPMGDMIETFALDSQHFSSLATDDMKKLLKDRIDEPGRELSDNDLNTTYRPIKILVAGFSPFHMSPLRYNSSQMIADYLDSRVISLDTDIGPTLVYISGMVLPVLWYEAADKLVEEVKLGYPDIVIGLGMKGYDQPSSDSDRMVEIEVKAMNSNKEESEDKWQLDDAGRTPEAAIRYRGDRNTDAETTDPSKVRDHGPPTLSNSDVPKNVPLPYDAIDNALNSDPHAISSFVDRQTPAKPEGGNAGTYMCNQIFYNLLYHNRPSIGQKAFKYQVMTGFIHIPARSELPPKERQSKFHVTGDIIVRECVNEYVKRGLYKQVKPFDLEKELPVPSSGDLLEPFPPHEWELDVW